VIYGVPKVAEIGDPTIFKALERDATGGSSMTAMDPIITQLHLTHLVVNANLAGIDDVMHFQAPAGGGNCLNWVLGHLVEARNGCLHMLQQDPVMDPELLRRYRRSTPPLTEPADGVPPRELHDAFNAAQEPLLAGLAAIGQAALEAPAPFSPTGNPDETVGSLLAGLVFHEAYHAGQLGLIRRSLGLDGVVK